MAQVTLEQLLATGLSSQSAPEPCERINRVLSSFEPAEAWRRISHDLLSPGHPFELHRLLYRIAFDDPPHPAAAWTPTAQSIRSTNLHQLMTECGVDSYEALHRWSVEHRADFWNRMVARLGIRFRSPFRRLLDLSAGVESPQWLVGARMNISDSCFIGQRSRIAVVSRREDGATVTLTLGQLEDLAAQVAGSLASIGLRPGDPVAIDLPMNAEAVAIYLGIVRAGCIAVSIADSLAPREIAVRCRLSGARLIFTQDHLLRGGKLLPLYEKVAAADAPRAVVLFPQRKPAGLLRTTDLPWDDFLSRGERADSLECNPADYNNILFSSGTTGDPKAIPWNHVTPIKCIADAWLHHDIHPGDRLAWPTNLGWMMGPWLIYASLVNRAGMALYEGSPAGSGFCHFVEEAGVTMLGVIPSLVKTWRSTGSIDEADWRNIKCFSSTGECSNADDMLFLMSRAGYKPIIEYCGGTECGGGYLASTLVQPNTPSVFSTPAMGLDLVILDEDGKAADEGELFLVPPSIGLSTTLLNQDHHTAYYEGVPPAPDGRILRRHGDRVQRLPNGSFRVQGRVDDTMNLGGIKVSSAEIERVLVGIAGVAEAAAVAVAPPGGGPSLLWLFAVVRPGGEHSPTELKAAMQKALSRELNPLFKIHQVVVLAELPRTASLKVMRRVLRDQAISRTASDERSAG